MCEQAELLQFTQLQAETQTQDDGSLHTKTKSASVSCNPLPKNLAIQENLPFYVHLNLCFQYRVELRWCCIQVVLVEKNHHLNSLKSLQVLSSTAGGSCSFELGEMP